MPYTCLVCAYPKLKEPPHSPGGGGSYEICPACGYQYGVDDDDKGITPKQWRATWVKAGAKWNSEGIKPPKGWKFELPPAAAKKAPEKKLPAGKAMTKKAVARKTVTLKKRAPRKKSS